MHVYDITSKRKTAANLLPIMEKECDYAESSLGAILLGICGDAAGDERKSQLDLVVKRPCYLAADCWPHQVSDICSYIKSSLTSVTGLTYAR